jgi:hypothetical protein
MKVKDYLKFAMCEYNNGTSQHYELGDIVFKKADPLYEDEDEVGIIIQVHDEFEYRTDMFGNCHHSELSLATYEEIHKHRPYLLEVLVPEPVEEIWERLGNTPINDSDEIDEVFMMNRDVFEKGTPREHIWQVIEADYDVRVYDLMYGKES